MEERDLSRRCVELGSLLASTGKPFKLLLCMTGYRFELDSSSSPPSFPRLPPPLPPPFARMTERPKYRPPPPRYNHGTVELKSSKKWIGPSRSRRDARRWQAHLQKKNEAPIPSTGSQLRDSSSQQEEEMIWSDDRGEEREEEEEENGEQDEEHEEEKEKKKQEDEEEEKETEEEEGGKEEEEEEEAVVNVMLSAALLRAKRRSRWSLSGVYGAPTITEYP